MFYLPRRSPDTNEELREGATSPARRLNRSDKLGLKSLLAQSHYLLGRDLQLSGKAGDAASHFAEAKQLLDDIKKEAGSDSVVKRSDLAPIYAQAGA
jgi:hypothetical protein